MRLGVGIAGCGVGAAHIAAYKALPDKYEVIALCDLDVDRARALGAQEGVPRVTREFSTLCAWKDLDLIDVCTPSYLHAQQALEALAAGKHVICEKPVAGSLRDIDALIAAEARAGRRVMPVLQGRFGAGIQKLRMLRDRGLAGRAYLATAETAWRRRPEYYAVTWRGKWETELGGALVTLGIHCLDLLLHVLGPAASVFAHAATRVNPIETEDCLSASLSMADGSLCSYGLTTGSAAESSRLRFCFDGLSAESNTSAYACPSEPWIFTGDSERHASRISEALQAFSPGPEGFEGQFGALHAALDAGTEIPVTLRSARRALEAITAIYASAHSGRPVELPIAEGDPCYASWRPAPSRQ
jgi:predicted dehydrogenase